MLDALLSNRILWTAIIAWFLAQFLKPFLEFPQTKRFSLGLWFSSGGNPSSHSALIVSTMLAIGFFHGFETPAFALAVAIAMIVVYDAAGVRREAGRHAVAINQIIDELFSGQPISEQELKEVIGHTPLQVVSGVILGGGTAVISYLLTLR
ncbi:MAG: divergent PAP2 family protein [Anaerolineae bacterium]|nr:divergent PAP2 family protein [Anaerolineae bacterium]